MREVILLALYEVGFSIGYTIGCAIVIVKRFRKIKER